MYYCVNDLFVGECKPHMWIDQRNRHLTARFVRRKFPNSNFNNNDREKHTPVINNRCHHHNYYRWTKLTGLLLNLNLNARTERIDYGAVFA